MELHGDLAYLKIIQAAGFIDPGIGVQQKLLTDSDLITRQTLNEWKKEGLVSVEHNSGRWYPLLDLIRFILDRAITSRTGGKSGEYKHWIETEAEYKAKERQLKFEILAGSFLPAEDVERVWAEYISACRRLLLSIPRAMASQLVGETNRAVIEKTVKDEINSAILELSQ